MKLSAAKFVSGAAAAAGLVAAPLIAAPTAGAADASGVWEIATGALLAKEKTRRTGGLSAMLLFLAVWPANFYHAYLERNEKGGKRVYHVLRQPAQVLLIEYARRIWKGPRVSAY